MFCAKSFTCCRVKYVKCVQHQPLRPQAGGSVGPRLTWCDALSGRLADWRPHDKGEAPLMCFTLSLFSCCCKCLYSLCSVQVAVKRLNTSNAPASAESLFLKEIQSLQLASSICHRACRMLGLCKLDGDACIVMTLYPKSAAKRLEELQGQSAAVKTCSYCCALYLAHGTDVRERLTDGKPLQASTQAFCLSFMPNFCFDGDVSIIN